MPALVWRGLMTLIKIIVSRMHSSVGTDVLSPHQEWSNPAGRKCALVNVAFLHTF